MKLSNINRAYLFKFFVNFHLIGGVLIPFFTIWGKITLFQIMVLQSWFVIWALIMEIPTGVVADYVGRKQSLILGALFWAIGIIVYVSTPKLPIFFLGEFILAIGAALYSGADEAFLYDSLKQEGRENLIGKTLARYQSSGLLALMIASPIGSLIGSYMGLRFAVMLMIIPMIFAVLVGMRLKEPPKEESHESTRYLDILKKGFEIIKGRRKIQWIAIDLAVVNSLSFLMIWLYQPLLMKYGVDIKWFGFVHAANTGIQILIMNSYHRLEKVFGGVEKLLALTVLLPAVFFIIAGSSNYLPIAVISIILTHGFGLTRKPLVSEELNQMIPSAQRATVLSAVMILQRFFNAGLNPIVGKLADWSVSLTLILLGMVLSLFFGFRYAVLKKYSIKSLNEY